MFKIVYLLTFIFSGAVYSNGAAASGLEDLEEQRFASCQFSDDIPSCVSSLKELEGICTDYEDSEDSVPVFLYDAMCAPLIFTCNLKPKVNIEEFKDIGLYRVRRSLKQWWDGDVPVEIKGPYSSQERGFFLYSRLIDNELSSYTLFEQHLFGEDSPCKDGSFMPQTYSSPYWHGI